MQCSLKGAGISTAQKPSTLLECVVLSSQLVSSASKRQGKPFLQRTLFCLHVNRRHLKCFGKLWRLQAELQRYDQELKNNYKLVGEWNLENDILRCSLNSLCSSMTNRWLPALLSVTPNVTSVEVEAQKKKRGEQTGPAFTAARPQSINSLQDRSPLP